MVEKQEIFDTEGLRSFIDPNDEEVVYYIAAPTANDLRGADYEYSKTYTKSLVEGITTSAEMTDILMRRGVIGPEFEQRANELSTILGEKITALEAATDVMVKQTLALEVAEARDELFQWNQRLGAPLSNTCEYLADDAKLEFITSCVVRYADGSRVWSSFDVYLTEKSQDLAQKARFEVMLYLQGLDSDFLENTPEATALREVGDELASTIAQAEMDAEESAAVEEQAARAETESEVKKTTPKTRRKKPVARKSPTNKKTSTVKRTARKKATKAKPSTK